MAIPISLFFSNSERLRRNKQMRLIIYHLMSRVIFFRATYCAACSIMWETHVKQRSHGIIKGKILIFTAFPVEFTSAIC